MIKSGLLSWGLSWRVQEAVWKDVGPSGRIFDMGRQPRKWSERDQVAKIGNLTTDLLVVREAYKA